MKATELIGKWAIRKYHITYAHGDICRSFMEKPIFIEHATDSHIIYKWHDNFLRICNTANDEINILSYEYCDNNWIDYDDLMAYKNDPIKYILMQMDKRFEELNVEIEQKINQAVSKLKY